MTKGPRIYNGGKGSCFSKRCWENWSATCKRMKVDHYLTPYSKFNSKYIKDLNITPEKIKFLEKTIHRSALTLILVMGLHQTKMLHYSKEKHFFKVKRQLTKWEKIFANYLIRG